MNEITDAIDHGPSWWCRSWTPARHARFAPMRRHKRRRRQTWPNGRQLFPDADRHRQSRVVRRGERAVGRDAEALEHHDDLARVLRRMPRGTLEQLVQRAVPVVGLHLLRTGCFERRGRPAAQMLGDARAVRANILGRAHVRGRLRVVHRSQVRNPVLDCLQERIRDLIHVIGEIADAAVASFSRALVQPLRRHLHDMALRGFEHVEPFADQHLFRQALYADFFSDEARDVLERLREHVVAPARHYRYGAHAERAQLVHRLRLRRHVDRLVLDAELGEELLDLDAARASGPPVDSQCIHVLLLAHRIHPHLTFGNTPSAYTRPQSGRHQQGESPMQRVRVAFALLLIAAFSGQAAAQYGGRRGGADRDRARSDPVPRDEVTTMSANDQVRMQLSSVRSGLKLTPEQASVWQVYENKVVDLLEDLSRGANQPQGGNALKQIDSRVDVVRNRLTAMEEIAEAANKLYASLSEEQKAMADRTLAGTLPALYSGTPARAALRRQ